MPLNILTIESSLYLLNLKKLYPNAALYAVTNYEEVINYKNYRNLNINWVLGGDIKIFPQKSFDIIIAESLFSHTKNSYDDLMAISRALKDTGFFLSTFKNIRYAPVLNEIKEGRFPFRDENLFAKDEVVKMLNDAIFKEIFFSPMEVDLKAQEIADNFMQAGFENYNDDLLTKTWMLKAAVSTSGALALKELYTKEIRKNLARLLRRIEYDVEREKNLDIFWNFLEVENIFPDYLTGFIEEICVYKKSTLNLLLSSAKIRGKNDFVEAMNEALL